VGLHHRPRIAGYLFAGGCLAYVVLMPAIKLFGSSMTEPMFGTTKLIRDMSAGEIRAAFVFYIGAGAVASAGIIALARSLPTIVSAFRAGFADMRSSRVAFCPVIGVNLARRRVDHHLDSLHDRVIPHLRPDRSSANPA
jgi:uncharacterized oligopeptide transporter (OPT) family protein